MISFHQSSSTHHGSVYPKSTTWRGCQADGALECLRDAGSCLFPARRERQQVTSPSLYSGLYRVMRSSRGGDRMSLFPARCRLSRSVFLESPTIQSIHMLPAVYEIHSCGLPPRPKRPPGLSRAQLHIFCFAKRLIDMIPRYKSWHFKP